MTLTCAPGDRRLALFDLDGTLTWRDTLMSYLCGYLGRHPAGALRLWRLAPALCAFLVTPDRGALKARVVRASMGGEPRTRVAAWSAQFVAGMHARRMFRPAALATLEAHRRAGDRLVLLSASPDLYVPAVGTLLGFEETICTELTWHGDTGSGETLEGALRSANRRGEEKARCLAALRMRHPGIEIVAYGNSRSDLPVLAAADRGLLVNAGASTRRLAAARGIPSADWG